jgi:hypothetical protein
VHRSGNAHGNCDALSRRPEDSEEASAMCRRVEDLNKGDVTTDVEFTPDIIATEQTNYEALQPLISSLKSSEPRPSWSEVKFAPEETRVYWAQNRSLVLQNGVLCKQFYRPDEAVSHLQTVMPRALRQEFSHQLHDGGSNVVTAHLGVKKTQSHVSQRAYWVNWKTDVECHCRRCAVCQSVQHGVAPRHGQLKLNEACEAGERIHIDLTGPHPSSRQGSIYILIVIDDYTRFLITVPLKNKSAVNVANALVERVFLPFGCCRSLVSHQCTEFCNDALNEVTKLLGIQKLRTTAYRAAADGRVERVHRTLNTLFCKVVSDNQKDWQDHLPMVTVAYNASCHESKGFSPFYFLSGQEYCTPIDFTLKSPGTGFSTVLDYVDQLRERLQNAYGIANSRMHTVTQRMKKRYDAKVKTIQLEPGSSAWYYCPRRKIGR